MPYGDREKQKLYQKLYYEKYNKKPTLKRGGKLKIDLAKYEGKPIGKVHNPTLNHYSKPLTFYTDFGKVNTNGDVIDFLDVKGNMKSNKQIKVELDGGKRKTIRQPSKQLLNSVDLYEIEKEIPSRIRNMTNEDMYDEVDEVSECIDEEVLDEIIEDCNELYGNKKSRRKLEYALFCMLKCCC